MRARKVPCRYYYVIRNVAIQKIVSVSFSPPDPHRLPSFKDEKAFTIENCLSSDYSYKENVTYKSYDETSFSFTKTLTNVSQFNSSFDLNVSFFDDIGAKVGESKSKTITYSVGTTTGYRHTENYAITQPLDITVPKKTIYKISYSDTKWPARIPVTIKAVLKADKIQEIRALAGNVAQSSLVEKLETTSSDDQRTFELQGLVVVRGSDRTLRIRLTEEPCN